MHQPNRADADGRLHAVRGIPDAGEKPPAEIFAFGGDLDGFVGGVALGGEVPYQVVDVGVLAVHRRYGVIDVFEVDGVPVFGALAVVFEGLLDAADLGVGVKISWLSCRPPLRDLRLRYPFPGSARRAPAQDQ